MKTLSRCTAGDQRHNIMKSKWWEYVPDFGMFASTVPKQTILWGNVTSDMQYVLLLISYSFNQLLDNAGCAESVMNLSLTNIASNKQSGDPIITVVNKISHIADMFNIHRQYETTTRSFYWFYCREDRASSEERGCPGEIRTSRGEGGHRWDKEDILGWSLGIHHPTFTSDHVCFHRSVIDSF